MNEPIWEEILGTPLAWPWREAFSPHEKEIRIFLDESCPRCGKRSLRQFEHVYLHAEERDSEFSGRGTRWEWCAACGAYAPGDAMIVAGWESIDLQGIDYGAYVSVESVDAAIRRKYGVGDTNPAPSGTDAG